MTTFGQHVEPAFSLHDAVELRSLADNGGRSQARRFTRLRQLRREMRDGGYDGAIAFLTNVNVAAILARTGLPLPLVVGERTYPPSMPTSAALSAARRALYPSADLVVMQTEDGARWLEREAPRAHGAVIPNPLRWPIPDAAPRVDPTATVRAGRRLLLTAGRLSTEKRFDLLLRAFADLGEPAKNWDLVIAGEGPMRAALERLVRELEIGDRVSLPGQIGNMGAWLERADAFTLTSSFEGYPNALLEAVASGVPVAAIDCLTGVRDLVSDGVNGVLAARDADATAFAGALRTLLGRAWPQAAAYAAATRERHAIDQIADRWLSTLQRRAA
jgi:glycosyltransferase involved in cell wall biosynthesis